MRLAREVHDTLAQGFVGIGSQLDAVTLTLEKDAESARHHLDIARKMATHSLTEARRSVMDLRTVDLGEQDLRAVLISSAQRWVAGTAVHMNIEVSGDTPGLPQEVKHNLLRIAQEAVANTLKHASAKMIWVNLDMQNLRLHLCIKDDGQGFEPASAFSGIDGHFGLQGMRERAKRLGGELDVASHPGQGTIVEVTVPISA